MKPSKTGVSFRWHGLITAFLVTAVCIGFALSLLDLGESANALTEIGPQAWMSVVFLSLIMAVLRAVRVTVIAGIVQFAPVIRASFLHGAANAVLPARMGEAVLPLALVRYSGLDLMRAVGLLLIVRLGDLLALFGIGLLLVAALDFWSLSAGIRLLLTVVAVLLIVGVGIVPYVVRKLGRWAPRFVGGLVGRVAAAGERIGGGSRVWLVVLTLLIWITLGLAAQTSIAAAGLPIDFKLAWLASVAASLAFALPTNGIASIGPFEAAFVGVLVAAGAPAEAALAAAVHLHLCALIAAGLAALAAPMFPANRKDRVLCS